MPTVPLVASGRFFVASLIALTFAGCGGTASSPPSSNSYGLSPGYMNIAVEVAAPLDFSKYQYRIVFNTSGNGQTPEANVEAGNWGAASYALLVSSSKGAPVASAYEYRRSPNCRTCTPAYIQLGTTPAQISLVAGGSGAKTEFTILFQRSIFASPASAPAGSTWLFNAFTAPANGAVIDSMGRCGGCCVSPPLPIGKAFQQTVVTMPGASAIPPAAKLVSVEITNAP
jgi:hypothetical protein